MPELAILFRTLSASIDRFRLLRAEYPFQYRLERRRVFVSKGKEREQVVDTVTLASRPWQTYQPGHMITLRVGQGQVNLEMYVPSVQDLGDSIFQAAHCYTYGGPDTLDGVPAVRIDFRPRDADRLTDLGGSIYLDGERGFVRRAVFHVTHLERAGIKATQFTVTTTFREIAPNVQVFDRVESVQWLNKTGDTRQLEIDRLLTYQFQRGAPGS